MSYSEEVGSGVTAEAALGVLAASQHGVVSLRQIRDLGLSDSALRTMLRRGRLERFLKNVYRVTGAPEAWKQQLKAACLWAGGASFASHRGAGGLFELDGCPQGIVELSTTRNLRSPEPWIIVHRVVAPDPLDLTELEGFLLSDPARTLVDLAEVLSKDELLIAVEDALRRRLVSLARLRWRVQTMGVRGKKGARVLTELLDEMPPGYVVPESGLERLFLRFVKEERFPSPTRQHVIRDNGRFIGRVDFAYADKRLAVEVDSYKFHLGRGAFDKDRLRADELQALGWQVLYVTYGLLTTRRSELVRILTRLLK